MKKKSILHKLSSPVLNLSGSTKGEKVSANAAMDEYFVNLAELNTDLRIRIGNPDELSSNRFKQSLQVVKT